MALGVPTLQLHRHSIDCCSTHVCDLQTYIVAVLPRSLSRVLLRSSVFVHALAANAAALGLIVQDPMQRLFGYWRQWFVETCVSQPGSSWPSAYGCMASTASTCAGHDAPCMHAVSTCLATCCTVHAWHQRAHLVTSACAMARLLQDLFINSSMCSLISHR